MGFKNWINKRKEQKQNKWETKNAEALAAYKKRQEDDFNLKFSKIEREMNNLKLENITIKSLIKKGESKPSWKVIQYKDGKTIWYKSDFISYVSKVYTSGPENTFFFDFIIDGKQVTISEDSEQKALDRKLELLGVERIEDFDLEAQAELFDTLVIEKVPEDIDMDIDTYRLMKERGFLDEEIKNIIKNRSNSKAN